MLAVVKTLLADPDRNTWIVDGQSCYRDVVHRLAELGPTVLLSPEDDFFVWHLQRAPKIGKLKNLTALSSSDLEGYHAMLRGSEIVATAKYLAVATISEPRSIA